jgi:NADH:ubiquinone oxidoreductase subunit 3 (subunit A)
MVRALLSFEEENSGGCLEGCIILSLFIINNNCAFAVNNNIMYKKLFIFFLAALAFVILLTSVTWILIKKKKTNVKTSSYECGYEPIGSPIARFEVHFYIISILFIIFDVEVLFLYP